MSYLEVERLLFVELDEKDGLLVVRRHQLALLEPTKRNQHLHPCARLRMSDSQSTRVEALNEIR